MSRESRRQARERERQEQERRRQREEEGKQHLEREMAASWQQATADLGALFRSELYRIEASFNPKTGEVTIKTDAEMMEWLTTLASGREWRPEWKLTPDPD